MGLCLTHIGLHCYTADRHLFLSPEQNMQEHIISAKTPQQKEQCFLRIMDCNCLKSGLHDPWSPHLILIINLNKILQN